MSGGWLTDQEATILALLVSKGAEMYGLEMTRAEAKSLSANTIYIVLTRMVAKGYLASRMETDGEHDKRGPKRRLYKMTSYGEQMLAAHRLGDEAVQRVPDIEALWCAWLRLGGGHAIRESPVREFC